MKFKSIISKSFFYICEHTGRIGMIMGMTYKYFYVRKRLPNFICPKNLSERILSSMLKKSFLKYSSLADKIKVRDYITTKGLDRILLKQYGSWNNANDIKLDELPQKFILKPNNGSGGHVICRDKSRFDLDNARVFLNENLKRGSEYYLEPHYRKIEPKILCEELLDVGSDKNPTDYKFTCINGEIVDIFIAEEDKNGKRKYATVDTNWEPLDYTMKEYLLDPIPHKPNKLAEMVKYALILSADFDFVRVDFYEFENKVYFGELTFSPWGGYMYSYSIDSLKLLGAKLLKKN